MRGKRMRISICFDSFMQGGGAERISAVLANELNADIITCGYRKEVYREWVKGKVIDLGNWSVKFNERLGWLESAARFYLNRKRFEYDVNIFSGFFSVYGAQENQNNIWLCVTPNRTLYDLRKRRMNELGFLQKLLWKRYIDFFCPRDQKAVKKRFKKIVSISKNVQSRVKKFYGLDSEIVYPPIETKKYYFSKFGDFYFTAGRLVPEKRFGLIAEAFAEMQEKKLVIAGFGPEEKNIRKIAEKHGNIKCVGRLTEKKLAEYYANCFATVYMPVDEDFGMVPLEGNASGKPCIAVNEGGCRETVVKEKTGFPVEPKKEEIIKAVRGLNENRAKAMKKDCIEWSKRFDSAVYIKKWKKIIESAR